MGEPVHVLVKPTSRSGYLRFETNRSFTGMGHERYLVDVPIYGQRPPDELARRMFATGRVSEVHVYGMAVTVKLSSAHAAEIVAELTRVVEDLYTHYLPGVEVPTAESFAE
ncbi:MAG: hypothetical protein ACK5RL_07080 [Acidimicrobiales bacterium]